ncbi:hypothetical protein [Leifsonia sp. 1010]|nr:hypothetical protein [Leifsonia sp. 1010]MDR6613915.1 antitoxin YefM [Leifsonia sp. 1010]
MAITAPKDERDCCQTAYLLRSPRNARRLMDAIKSAHRGDAIERPLVEE